MMSHQRAGKSTAAAGRFCKTDSVFSRTLDNGLRLLVWEDRQAPVAACYTWFAVGSASERPGRTGMAHLFEHLMFKETRNLPAGEFDRILENNGVSTNAATWLDWTYYQEHLPSSKLALVLELEADRMANMVLNEEQLNTEREVVRNERLLRVDNDPEGLSNERLYDLHFGDHPYGHPTLGWMADIEAITLADCLSFYDLYYAPNNATLVVVGDVAGPQVAELAQRFYGSLPARPTPAPAVARPPRVAGRSESLSLAVHAAKAMVLCNAPPLGGRLSLAYQFLADVLFNSESARLHRRLVEEEEVAVDVSGWYGGFRLGGVFEMQFNMVPGVAPDVALAALDEELARAGRDGLTVEEFEAARNRREMSFLRGLLSAVPRAQNLGHFQVTAGSYEEFFARQHHLAALTHAEVNAVARELAGEARTTVTVVPAEAAEVTP